MDELSLEQLTKLRASIDEFPAQATSVEKLCSVVLASYALLLDHLIVEARKRGH